MSAELNVECPKCGATCDVAVDNGDLAENQTTEGFIGQCGRCGCSFRFDLNVDVMNKEIFGQ